MFNIPRPTAPLRQFETSEVDNAVKQLVTTRLRQQELAQQLQLAYMRQAEQNRRQEERLAQQRELAMMRMAAQERLAADRLAAQAERDAARRADMEQRALQKNTVEAQIYDPNTGQYQDTTVVGGSVKERQSALAAQQDALLQQFMETNEAFKKLRSPDFEHLDVQRKDKAVRDAQAQASSLLGSNAPTEVRERFTNIVDSYLDPYMTRVAQEYQSVEASDDWDYFRDSLKLGLKRGWDSIASIGESPEELRKRNTEFNEYEKTLREQNPYMLDQYRRAQQGEGFFEQMTGPAGNVTNNILGGLLSSPVEMIVPAAIAAATAPVSVPLAVGAGLLGGMLTMAPSMGWEYQRSILNDPTLSTAEQDTAIEEGTNIARGMGAGIGLVGPVAGKVAGAVGSKLLKANAGQIGRAVQGTGAAFMEGLISGGAEQFTQNVATQVGTGRDVDLLEGTWDVALQEAVIGAPVGTAVGMASGYIKRDTAPSAPPDTNATEPATGGEASPSAGGEAPAGAPQNAAERMEYDRQFRAQMREWERTGQPITPEVVSDFRQQYMGDNVRTANDWENFVGNNSKVAAQAQLSPELQSALEGSVGRATLDASEILTTSRRLETVYNSLDASRMGIAQSLFKELNKTKTGQTQKAVEIIQDHMKQGLTAEEVSAIVTVASQKRKPGASGTVVDALLNKSMLKAARENAQRAFKQMNKEAAAKKAEQQALLHNNIQDLRNQTEDLNGPAGNVEPAQSGTAAAGGEPAAGGNSGVAAPAQGAAANSPAGNAVNAPEGSGTAQGGWAGGGTEPNNGPAVPTQGNAQGAQSASGEGGTQRGPGAGNAAPTDAAAGPGTGAAASEGNGPAPRAGDEANAGGPVNASGSPEQRPVASFDSSPDRFVDQAGVVVTANDPIWNSPDGFLNKAGVLVPADDPSWTPADDFFAYHNMEPGSQLTELSDPVPHVEAAIEAEARDTAEAIVAQELSDPEYVKRRKETQKALEYELRRAYGDQLPEEAIQIAGRMFNVLNDVFRLQASTVVGPVMFDTLSPEGAFGAFRHDIHYDQKRRRLIYGNRNISLRMFQTTPEDAGATLLHETMHHLVNETAYQLQNVPREYWTRSMRQVHEDITTLGQYVGAKNPEAPHTWTKDQHERVTTAFEAYLSDGGDANTPPELKPLFDKFARAIKTLFNYTLDALSGNLGNYNWHHIVMEQGVVPEINDIFNRFLGGYSVETLPDSTEQVLSNYLDAKLAADDMAIYEAWRNDRDLKKTPKYINRQMRRRRETLGAEQTPVAGELRAAFDSMSAEELDAAFNDNPSAEIC